MMNLDEKNSARKVWYYTYMRCINNYRLYIQVYCLSKVVTGSGTHFSQEAWNCLHNPLQRTHVTWPTQPGPGLCARKCGV